jgi:D-beta-D-heptose 7-phosphate kinase/D-beta-D-heptose 1-phosphate adenosyltransferase
MYNEPTQRVWFNGVFDVLHMGHIRLFQHAKKLHPSSIICVGVDADERVRQNKGDNRPINSLIDRMEFLSSLRLVDEVVSFSTDGELRDCIALFSPDIMLIGEEYDGRDIIGQELIPRIVYVKKYGNLSTTKIVNGG